MFKNGHYAADQVYFYKFNSKNSGKVFSFSKNPGNLTNLCSEALRHVKKQHKNKKFWNWGLKTISHKLPSGKNFSSQKSLHPTGPPKHDNFPAQ